MEQCLLQDVAVEAPGGQTRPSLGRYALGLCPSLPLLVPAFPRFTASRLGVEGLSILEDASPAHCMCVRGVRKGNVVMKRIPLLFSYLCGASQKQSQASPWASRSALFILCLLLCLVLCPMLASWSCQSLFRYH